MESASPDMAARLTDLALRSKRHWGYSDDLIALWRSDLVITPDLFETNLVEVAMADNAMLGFYSIHQTGHEVENFWVIPEKIGTGLGRWMFEQMILTMRAQQIDSVTIVSDPHAAGFYAHMGARPIGASPSVPVGRMLPVFRYALEASVE